MGLAENILANEKVMDKLGKIYAETMFTYYGNGKRGTDADAKKEMIYYLEQNCGVCRTPSSIASQLSKIWGKIQEEARKYGYRGPIVQPKPEGLSYHLQDIANKVLADEQIMNALGSSCYYASQQKNLAKGAMMSDKYWGSYPNELKDWVRDRHWGYIGFNEAKEIVKFIKKDIAKYAKIAQQKEQAKNVESGEMNETDEIGETPKYQKMLGMAGARRAIKGKDRGSWGQKDAVGGNLPGNTTSDVPIYSHAAQNWKSDPKLRDSFVSGVQKMYKKMTGNKNGVGASGVYENKLHKLSESQLKSIIMEAAKKVLKEMDELSPKLLQNAADTAWDRGRYSQAENFESEAGARASSEFGGDNNIRRITAKNIACVSPDGSAWSISRDGSYYFRPKSGYNNESGHLTGMTKFPDYMKTDKNTARTIVKWWQKYNNADAEIPFMNDWHELVKW